MINLGNFIVNNYLVPLSQGYILVDTGYESGYERFCRELEKNKISMTDIIYVFLTHAHDDHAGFLNKLLTINPRIKVILHPKAIEGLRRGHNSFIGGCSNLLAFLFCKAMSLVGRGGHHFPAINIAFESNFILIDTPEAKRLGQELSMQFIETPGHTSCSVSLLHDGALYCGDAAMNGLPSWNRITIWVEDLVDYESSWERMIALQPQIIYPGHGKPLKYHELSKYMPKIRGRKLFALK